jgi:hypothetical protein
MAYFIFGYFSMKLGIPPTYRPLNGGQCQALPRTLLYLAVIRAQCLLCLERKERKKEKPLEIKGIVSLGFTSRDGTVG